MSYDLSTNLRNPPPHTPHPHQRQWRHGTSRTVPPQERGQYSVTLRYSADPDRVGNPVTCHHPSKSTLRSTRTQVQGRGVITGHTGRQELEVPTHSDFVHHDVDRKSNYTLPGKPVSTRTTSPRTESSCRVSRVVLSSVPRTPPVLILQYDQLNTQLDYPGTPRVQSILRPTDTPVKTYSNHSLSRRTHYVWEGYANPS